MNKAEKWSVFITYANGDPIEQKLEFIDGPEKARRRSVTFIWSISNDISTYYLRINDHVYVLRKVFA